MPPIGVLIKPASSKCNMRCKYCFYHSIADNRITKDFGYMNEEIIELIVKKTLAFASGKATFSFQGGEPTLCGLEFFKKVIEFEKKHNVHSVEVENCIQTNGLQMDDDWARFLHENRFLVGLSLDGPSEIHDVHRVDGKGKGTFQRVMHTVNLFKKYEVDFNILFVVSALSGKSPEKIYNFFKKNDFRFLQFIPCIDPKGTRRGSHPYSLKPDVFEMFLKKMFDCWRRDLLSGREISIRHFDNYIRMIMGMQPEACSMMGKCQCQFVFESDGSVYPCDFYVTDQWRMGHIASDELMEMYETEVCRKFLASAGDVRSLCQGCKWIKLCRGGCRCDRENTMSGEIERNYYCKAYTGFFEYAFPRMIEVAKYVTQKST